MPPGERMRHEQFITGDPEPASPAQAESAPVTIAIDEETGEAVEEPPVAWQHFCYTGRAPARGKRGFSAA